MKADIKNRKDIEHFVREFYHKAFKDDLIGFIFTDIVKLDLEKHLPKIADFWETILFDRQKYSGSPMNVHIAIDQKIPLLPEYFDRWLNIFRENLDEFYVGEKVEEAKKRAGMIAGLMQHKVERLRDPKNLV